MYPYGLQDKKVLNLLILEILEQYTDSEHRLTQLEIVDLLEKNYGVACTRQTIKNHLMLLEDMGYEIPLITAMARTSSCTPSGKKRTL